MKMKTIPSVLVSATLLLSLVSPLKADSSDLYTSEQAKSVIQDAETVSKMAKAFYTLCGDTSLGINTAFNLINSEGSPCSLEYAESITRKIAAFKIACEPCFFGNHPIFDLTETERRMTAIEKEIKNLKRLVDDEIIISRDVAEELRTIASMKETHEKQEAERKKQEAEELRTIASMKEAHEKQEAERKKQEAEQAQPERDEQEAIAAFGANAWAIQEEVRTNWNPPDGNFEGFSVLFTIRVDREGNVTSVTMVRSSGNAKFDESAENAIYKASPLPIPGEPRFYKYLKEFDFKFEP